MNFLFLALFNIYILFSIISNNDLSTPMIIISIIITIISSAISILAGLGGIFKYIGKKNILSNFIRPYAIFLSIIIIINMSGG